MSFMSSKSKKILEKMRQREEGQDAYMGIDRPTQASALRKQNTEAQLRNNVTDSSDLIINDRNYKPIRYKPTESALKSNSSQSYHRNRLSGSRRGSLRSQSRSQKRSVSSGKQGKGKYKPYNEEFDEAMQESPYRKAR